MVQVIPVAARLKALRERAGLSVRAVADWLQMPQGSSYQHYESRYKKELLPVSLVRELAPLFTRSGHVKAVEVFALAGLPGDVDETVLGPAEPDTHRIPVIDYITAGKWGEVADPYPKGTGHDYVDAGSRTSKRAFALVVRGKSMAPDFQEGDLIIVDPDISPHPGDCVVAKLDREQEATFKKYRPRGKDKKGCDIIELVPINPDFPELMIDHDHPGQIVGTVIEHRRQLRR